MNIRDGELWKSPKLLTLYRSPSSRSAASSTAVLSIDLRSAGFDS